MLCEQTQWSVLSICKRQYSLSEQSIYTLRAAGDEKDAGGDVLKIGKQEHELYFVAGRKAPFYERPDLDALPPGDLTKAAAHWCEHVLGVPLPTALQIAS